MALAILIACIGGWITILCLSIYAHRAMAHRSLTLHPVVAHFMRFWLWLTTGTRIRAWVAVHRKHHAFVDRDGDPHSPAVHGIARIFFFGYWYYRRESLNPETLERYGKGCPDDWVERNLYGRFEIVGLVLMLGLDLLLFGLWPGLVAFGIQIAWVSLWAGGVINGLGHRVGYRNFKTRDASRNLIPLAIAVCGEELHNNHHHWPRSAKFSARLWEIDISWLIIRALAALGLAKDVYVFDRRLDEHQAMRAENRMRALFARWCAKLAALERDQRASRAAKRRELERRWARFSRRLERRIARFDQNSRQKLSAVRDEILRKMRAAFPELFNSEVLGPA